MEFFSLPADWSAEYDGWIVVVAILAAITCAVPGCFLLVRRQSML
jgi:ABC-type Mn2+/Zn2+ transport system permease subunit